MILEQVNIIIKMFILGIFIAIMFDNISRYCNYVISFVLWLPLIYVICRVMVNITNMYELTYIIYYLCIFSLAYFIYYKYMKSELNNKIDSIIQYVRNNKKIKKIFKTMFFVNEFIFIKNKLKELIKKMKIKRKKVKKDLKNI